MRSVWTCGVAKRSGTFQRDLAAAKAAWHPERMWAGRAKLPHCWLFVGGGVCELAGGRRGTPQNPVSWAEVGRRGRGGEQRVSFFLSFVRFLS